MKTLYAVWFHGLQKPVLVLTAGGTQHAIDLAAGKAGMIYSPVVFNFVERLCGESDIVIDEEAS